MPTLKEDLWPYIIEIAQFDTQFEVRDIDRWTDKLMTILRRHPYDLMQLATVRKVHPHIDTLPAPERDDTATGYFKDDPQGKGW